VVLKTMNNQTASGLEQNTSGRAEGIEHPEATNTAHLYHAYSPRVYSMCLRMTRNTADAEDLTQQVFLQLCRKLDTFRGEAAFSTWLHRLSVNVVLMQLRRQKVYNETSLDELMDPVGNLSPTYRQLSWSDTTLAGTTDRFISKGPSTSCRPGSGRFSFCTTLRVTGTTRLPSGYALLWVPRSPSFTEPGGVCANCFAKLKARKARHRGESAAGLGVRQPWKACSSQPESCLWCTWNQTFGAGWISRQKVGLPTNLGSYPRLSHPGRWVFSRKMSH
jgi:RNA polymerase sigma-70 factor (ECF subfamily)